MPMLTKDQIEAHLENYYRTHCGERDTDEWYDSPAVNVRMFARDGELIALQCHIISGEVTERRENLTK